MDIIKQLKRFLKYASKKYEADGSFALDGVAVQTLIRESGVKFGSPEMQLTAMNILLEQGFIEPVDCGEQITLDTRIKLTLLSMDTAHRDWINNVSKSRQSRQLRKDIDNFIYSGSINWRGY